jgi:hypothetical protein
MWKKPMIVTRQGLRDSVSDYWIAWWPTGMRTPIVRNAKGQKFFASFFQKRSSFLKERTKEFLLIHV